MGLVSGEGDKCIIEITRDLLERTEMMMLRWMMGIKRIEEIRRIEIIERERVWQTLVRQLEKRE